MRLEIRPDYQTEKQQLILIDGSAEQVLFSEEDLFLIEVAAEAWYMGRGLDQKDAHTLAEDLAERGAMLWDDFEQKRTKADRDGFNRGRNSIIRRVERMGVLNEEQLNKLRDPRPHHLVVNADGTTKEIVSESAKEEE